MRMVRIFLLLLALVQPAAPQAETQHLYIVREGGKIGFIDAHANLIVPAHYDDALPFANGLAPVKVGKLWGYITEDGQTVFAPQFQHAYPFGTDGFAYVSEPTQKSHWITRDGKF